MNSNDYQVAIKEYERGNKSRVESILKMLSKQQYVKYDSDINYFISVVQHIAKKNNDSTIIAYTKQVGNKISTRDGNTHGYTSSHENVLSTENECIFVLKKSLSNDEFDVIIDNVIEFIKKEKKFHTALAILQTIDNANIQSNIFAKKDVALLFIEKMYKVIALDVKPKVEGTLIKKYISKWPNFSSKDFTEYQKIVEKYSKQYSIKQIFDYVLEVDKTLKAEQEYLEKLKKEEIIEKQNKSFPVELRLGPNIVVRVESIKYNGSEYSVKFSSNYYSNSYYCYNSYSKNSCIEQGYLYHAFLRSIIDGKICIGHRGGFSYNSYSKTIYIDTIKHDEKYYVIVTGVK